MIPPAFHRSLLAPREQLIYREIVNSLLGYSSTVVISTNDVDCQSLGKIINAVHLDHPELFYVDFWHFAIVPATLFSPLSIRFSMMIASHTAKSVSSKMELCADSLRKSTTTSNSAEQMYAVVIRKIASSVEYQDTKSAFWDHTAAGPILHHTSVCEGIAKLFLFFCLRLSLPCAVITGTLNGAPHAWNVVEICGKRKYVDVTSFLRAPQAVYLFPKTLFRSKNRMIEAGYLWVDE